MTCAGCIGDATVHLVRKGRTYRFCLACRDKVAKWELLIGARVGGLVRAKPPEKNLRIQRELRWPRFLDTTPTVYDCHGRVKPKPDLEQLDRVKMNYTPQGRWRERR